MIIQKEEIIYQHKYSIDNCMVGTRYYELYIFTWVSKTEWFNGLFTTYKIHQNNPKVKNPIFDGEYATNKIISIAMRSERNWAKKAIVDYKINR